MWRRILATTVLVGTLDILAAFLNAYLSNGTQPGVVLQYIASGLFGREAFAGGIFTMALGLVFHFLIAFSCVVAFFLSYQWLRILRYSIWLNGILIALVAWFVTTQVIVSLSLIPRAPFDLTKTLVAILILFFCVGLPTAISAQRSQRPRQSRAAS